MQIGGISAKDANAIRQVLADFPQIEQAVLYGSRAMGNFRTGSDIDITLLGEDLSFSILVALNQKLDDLLLPYSFDLSILSNVKDEEVRDHISRVGKTLYKSEVKDLD